MSYEPVVPYEPVASYEPVPSPGMSPKRGSVAKLAVSKAGVTKFPVPYAALAPVSKPVAG